MLRRPVIEEKASNGMKVRRFTAKSYSEALQMVKESLGPDAVILSNRLVASEPGEGDGQPSVEVTAATGEGAAGLLQQGGGLRHHVRRHGEVDPPRRSSCPEVLRPFRRRLLEEEVRERLVDQVIDAVTRRLAQLGPRGMARALDFVLSELMERILVLPEERRPSRPRLTCMVGSSGTGKTTLLTKLAVVAALQERQKVAIVAMGKKGNAREMLRMTAGVLECPMRDAETPQVLKRVLDELTGFDQIFLDAPGMSPFDDAAIARLGHMFTVAPGVELHLVLNANSRDIDLLKALEAFGGLGLKALAFGRLDESSCFGGVLNAVDSSRLPLSWFGFGREIPSDLERASRERVLDLLLDLSSLAQVGAGG
jgi:flagellar biosynthesis protein FlhF